MSRLTIIAATASLIALYGAAEAADISGVWVSNPTVCNKVFVKRGNTIRFTESADMYGSGFIIEGNRIRGKMVTCTIKARQQEGDTVHLLAHCATDIALSDNQFSLQIVDANKMSRIFPGMPELKTDYFRCQM